MPHRNQASLYPIVSVSCEFFSNCLFWVANNFQILATMESVGRVVGRYLGTVGRQAVVAVPPHCQPLIITRFRQIYFNGRR